MCQKLLDVAVTGGAVVELEFNQFRVDIRPSRNDGEVIIDAFRSKTRCRRRQIGQQPHQRWTTFTALVVNGQDLFE